MGLSKPDRLFSCFLNGQQLTIASRFKLLPLVASVCC
uniref:Uncharacterized protein n=1 Tax=Arundo donax TaxID=35708 RepID=A0A0A9AA70_ARUDO